jgi:hypothetical protein
MIGHVLEHVRCNQSIHRTVRDRGHVRQVQFQVKIITAKIRGAIGSGARLENPDKLMLGRKVKDSLPVDHFAIRQTLDAIE